MVSPTRQAVAGSSPRTGRGVAIGLLLIGFGLFLDRLASWASTDQPWSVPALAIGASGLVFLLGFGLLALESRRLPGWSRPGPEASLELASISRRLEEVLERWEPESSDGPSRSIAVAEIRQAIDQSQWEDARKRLDRFRVDYPAAHEAEGIARELHEMIEARIRTLRGQLEAAQAANDADRVLGYRDELARVLEPAERTELDRAVIAWIMNLIQKRLRAGSVRTDVANLAARAAISFSESPEGASLRAALPTLRRSAGLCARCARPYTGVADACPDCLRAGLAGMEIGGSQA